MKGAARSIMKWFDFEPCRLSAAEMEAIPPGLPVNYKEAQIYRALSARGQISMEEARFLCELVRNTDPTRPIVEIGTLYGFSTLIMCTAKVPEQKLYSVDNFSWNSLGISSAVHYAATRDRLAECVDRYGVELVNSSAQAFYESYAGPPPSLFFCDADHTYEAVKADIAWARGVGSAIICGDDYAPEHHGVRKAVDECGGPAQIRGGLWVL